MSIEIVSIGSELLAGEIVNTNASYLCRRLKDMGWDVARQMSLPDEKESLVRGLKEVLARSDVAIATGGLGPTLDDISEECAASLFSTPPEKIPNNAGSAPGLIFGGRLVLLPGVPQEMSLMFEESVVPFLQKRMPPPKLLFREALHFCLLSESYVDPLLRHLEKSGVQFGIYPSYGTLTVRLSSETQRALERAKDVLKEQFKEHLLPASTVEEALHSWFIEHKKTLALAESCTGGVMASRLTALAGASNYFLGSFVVYSNALKETILGVRKETLEKQGAVSAEVVQEMLQGVFAKTKADWAAAVSGIAGPSGGTVEKPVGTIWYAVGERGKKPIVCRLDLGRRSRETVVLISSGKILSSMWQAVFSGG